MVILWTKVGIFFTLLVFSLLAYKYFPNSWTLTILLLLGSFAPIWVVVDYWPKWSKLPSQLAYRVITALGLAFYYAFGPRGISFLVKTDPFIIPVKEVTKGAMNPIGGYASIPSESFIILLLTLAAIFIALASQQASHVNRLDNLREKYKRNVFPAVAAAYYLVASGFWAFSFAVPVVVGLIWFHLSSDAENKNPTIYGAYEWIIALLFVGGWIVLMAGALRTFTYRRNETQDIEEENAIEQRKSTHSLVIFFKAFLALIGITFFLDDVHESDFQLEVSRNPQHGAGEPQVIASRRAQVRDKTVNRLRLLRRALGYSFLLIASACATGALFAAIFYGSIPKPSLPITNAVGSAFCFAWATLGRLGWTGFSWKRNTIFEVLDEILFRLLYWLGAFFGAVAVLASGTD